VGSGLRVRPVRARDRAASLEYLEQAPRLNLVLLDLVLRLGEPLRGEPRPQLLAAWRGRELAGLVGLRPSVVLDAAAEREALEAFFPYLGGVGSGLVKSTEDVVAPLWEWLAAHGRRALLDRIEQGYALEPQQARLVPPGGGLRLRPAEARDLDALVEAARASLLEEQRPDPSSGDPAGFRLWVRSRLPRSIVCEADGRVCFVGYADVRCSRGWLLQGVFTWPELRGRGLGSAGVSELCRRAFESGADHVQLAVVEGNSAAAALYEGLGFRPFARLRTLLFS
jgi:RimJ/RimL family protein N-acetyltransferase